MFDVTLICKQGACGEGGTVVGTVHDVDSRKRNGFDVLEAMRQHEVEKHGGKSR